MSMQHIDPPSPPAQGAVRLSPRLRLSGMPYPGISSSSAYRPRSRSLASTSLIPPTATNATITSSTAYSPSLSSTASTISSTWGGRQSPPLALLPPSAAAAAAAPHHQQQQLPSSRRRVRAASVGQASHTSNSMNSRLSLSPSLGRRRIVHDPLTREQARTALEMNDAMVYLDGPQVYACQQCRTHLTSHDDIISKSFHGRRGRAYLFDKCVNVRIGPPEDRMLITGLHSVCDISCQRCRTLVGWTYKRAYEASQKYKEGKFIIEKINLYLEESDAYDVQPPAGERRDRWRQRSQSWGSEEQMNTSGASSSSSMVYEYAP